MIKNILNTLAKQQMDAVTTIPSWKTNGGNNCLSSASDANKPCESKVSGFKDLNEFYEKFQIAVPIGGHCLTWRYKTANENLLRERELIEQLKNPSPIIKMDAAEDLGKMGIAAMGAVPALIKALEDEHIKLYATSALGKIGPAAKDAVPALIETLEDEDPVIRYKAAWALDQIDPEHKLHSK